MARRRRWKDSAGKGFTLLELMMVVAILAILAVVGTASYQRSMRRVRASEAYGMLSAIKQRQDSYFTEFHQFCDVSSSSHDGTAGLPAGHWPASPPGRNAVDWFSGLPAEWTALGAAPAGRVYFRYDTVGGNPGVTPGFGGGLNYAASPDRVAWWAAHAYGDLDGDGVRSTFEAFSMTESVWVNGPENE